VGVAALLGAEQGRLLLRSPDEQHPLGGGELGQVFVHHVVLALPLREVDPRHTVDPGEPMHRGAERVGDLRQRRGRGDRQPQLPMQIADQSLRVLQLRDIDVEIHPVDALHLEPHMLGQDISDGSRYGHDGLRSDGRPAGQLTATCGSYTGPVRRSRSPTDRSPQPPPAEDTPRRAGAKPR
jgi:hypothetical protein